MSENVCHFESILKSSKKTFQTLQNNQSHTTYWKCRAARPLILKILRHFHDLEKEFAWNELLQVTYMKATKEFLPILDNVINKSDMYLKPYTTYRRWVDEVKYLNIFKKNLLKIKKKSEDTTIAYYNYLPGSKLPLDIRTKIVSFISLVPMFDGDGQDRKYVRLLKKNLEIFGYYVAR
tara:strand:+ start:73 stop:606 length:534 start_codon:yes stop_codon:yes gene_type:complete